MTTGRFVQRFYRDKVNGRNYLRLEPFEEPRFIQDDRSFDEIFNEGDMDFFDALNNLPAGRISCSRHIWWNMQRLSREKEI